DINIKEDDSLAQTILNIYAKTGETFIIIIDEYDVLVREQVPQETFDKFLRMLNGLFKSDTLRPAISLAYLTGILPIVRDKIQSKLNNFDEFTILNASELSEFVGFTNEDVIMLSDTYGLDLEECQRWYDGYKQNGYEIYNPESVIKAIIKKEFT
ncbi:MAG: AAA family ATPase, partial [Pseudobutyrivibrio sp.]|nr:AAA family ATPase [Pseudobutyrivibrio sp.]